MASCVIKLPMTVAMLGQNKRDICIKMLELLSYHILGYPGSFSLSTSIPGILFFNLSKMFEQLCLCLNTNYFQMLQHTYGHTICKICKNISIWSTPLTVHPTPVKGLCNAQVLIYVYKYICIW